MSNPMSGLPNKRDDEEMIITLDFKAGTPDRAIDLLSRALYDYLADSYWDPADSILESLLMVRLYDDDYRGIRSYVEHQLDRDYVDPERVKWEQRQP